MKQPHTFFYHLILSATLLQGGAYAADQEGVWGVNRTPNMEAGAVGSGIVDVVATEPMAKTLDVDVSSLMLAGPLAEPAEIITRSRGAEQKEQLDSSDSKFKQYRDLGGQPSLSAVVERGLRLNPEVQAETAQVAQMLTEIKISKSGYWPSLELSAGPENGLSGELGYNISLSQMLFDWGRTSSDVSAANAKHRKQAQVLLMTRNDAALEIVEVCLDMLSASDQVGLIERAGERLESILNLVKKRSDAGYGTDAELYRIQQVLEYMQEQKLSMHSRLRELENEYQLLTGYSGSDIPRFVADTSLIDEMLTGDALEKAIQRSPQYMKAQEELLLAQSQIDSVEAGLKPRLMLEASSERREIGGVMTDDSTLALRLRVDLMQGLSGFQRTKAERQGLEAAQWKLRAVRRELLRSMESAHENIIAFGQRTLALQQQLKHLATIRGSYQKQFVAGSRTIDDLISIERELYELEVQAINASYEYQRVPYRITADLGLLTHLIAGQLEESLRP